MENKTTRSSQNNSQNKKKYNTFIGATLHVLFMLCLVSLLAWVLLIIWFGVDATFYSQINTGSSIRSLIESNVKLISSHPLYYVDQLYLYVEKLKIYTQYYINYIFEIINVLLSKVDYQLFITRPEHSELIVSIVLGTMEIVLTRLIIFLMNLPFLLSILFVLSVDGLGQRDIRKFQNARESSFFFHRIKPLIGKVFYSLFLVYMVLPINMSPIIILLPMSVLMSLFAMISIKNYKKYV